MSNELNKSYIMHALSSVTIWRRKSERAPHKPLLVLLAIGELIKGKDELPFETYEPVMRKLLEDFGPPEKTSTS